MDVMEQKIELLCLFLSFSPKCFYFTTPFFWELLKSFLSCFFYEEKKKMKEAEVPQAKKPDKKVEVHILWFNIQFL